MVEVDNKLAKVEDTDLVMGRVMDIVCEAQRVTEKKMKVEDKKLDERIKMIYEEELSVPGLFGNTF